MAITAATAATYAAYASYAALAISAVSAVASGVQQHQQMKSQQRYNEAQAENYRKTVEANNKQTAIEYADKMAAERVNQMQERKKTAQQIQQTQRESLQKSGTMMASTNAAGGALQFLMDDYTRQEAISKQAFRDQYQMAADSSNIAIDAYQKKAQNQMDSQSGYTYMDSGGGLASLGISTALQIGGAAVGAYGQYKSWTPNTQAQTTPIPKQQYLNYQNGMGGGY